MKAPDKIYIGLRNSEFGGVVYGAVSETYPNAKEYIRKDTLLEWANRLITTWKDTNLEQVRGRIRMLELLIDKLNSMG